MTTNHDTDRIIKLRKKHAVKTWNRTKIIQYSFELNIYYKIWKTFIDIKFILSLVIMT